MNVPPPSLSEKFAQAAALWLFASLVSIPLWEVAAFVYHDLRFGLFHSLIRHFLKPAETILGAMVIVWLQAKEFGSASFVSHYWPAVLIASAFTAFFLRWWWRRS